MAGTYRIATFNLENLDDKPGEEPSLQERIAVMRPQFLRLRADILCLQEVNGQEVAGQPRRLLALEQLLNGTPYQNCQLASTMVADGSQVYDERNLVILSRFPISEHHQHKHDFLAKPAYKMLTPGQPGAAEEVTWERPILYAKMTLPDGSLLHIVNVHLKSRLPSAVPGQQVDQYTWRSIAGWAEGFFVSSMKRVGQALETRVLLEGLFDQDPHAQVVVCGDFNADLDDVPVEAIRGDVENTGNGTLAPRVMVPCERTIPESSRFSLYHRGRGVMLDHLLVSRSLVARYLGSEIHNEVLHDESIAFAGDKKFPESDHAPVVAEFAFA